VPGSAKSIKDSASLRQFDSGGSLVSGKKLALDGNQGNYILTVAVIAPGSAVPRFAKLNFKAVDPAGLPPALGSSQTPPSATTWKREYLIETVVFATWSKG